MIKFKSTRYILFTLLLVLTLESCDSLYDEVTIVNIPDTSLTNSHYISNRKPLKPSVLIKRQPFALFALKGNGQGLSTLSPWPKYMGNIKNNGNLNH